MKVLTIKMLRDLRKMKGEFISIFFLTLIGMLLFTGFISGWKTMEKTGNKWSEEKNMADAWVNGDQISDELINQLESKSAILMVEKQTLGLVSIGKKNSDQVLQAVVTDQMDCSKLQAVSGESFTKEKAGVWLDKYYAEANGFKTKDDITLWYEDQKIETVVLGTIIAPDFISYKGANNDLVINHQKNGYVYSNSQTMPLFQTLGTNHLLLKLKSTNDPEESREIVEYQLGEHFVGYRIRETNPNVALYFQKVSMMKKLAILFSGVILILVLLTILTTIQRLVKQQQTIIATLKALGLRNRMILLHYSSYGFFISLLGSVAGLVIAPYTFTPFLLEVQEKQFMLGEWQNEFPTIIYLVGLLIVFLSTLTAYLASRKSVRALPAIMMRASSENHEATQQASFTTLLFNHFSFAWKWVLRDGFRNKKKVIVAAFAVFGSILLMIISFGIQYSVTQSNETLFGKEFDYRYSVQLTNQATAEQKEAIWHVTHEEGQWQETKQGQLKTAVSNENILINIIDPGIYLHLQDNNGETIRLDEEEIVLSHFLAEKWQIAIGDTVGFKPIGTSSYKMAVVTNIAYVSAPQGIFISSRNWQAFNYPFSPTTLMVGSSISQKKLLDQSGVSKVTSLNKQREDAEEAVQSLQKIIIFYGIFAAILSMIVLYNLGVLNFTERYREYATLRVLGFRKREIRGIILRDQGLSFVIGGLISLFLVQPVLKLFCQVASTEDLEIFPKIDGLRIILSFGSILICALLVGAYISRKVQKIEMTEALKNVE
ncbi:ABC transporter permease [Enterococcus sp. LJL99]